MKSPTALLLTFGVVGALSLAPMTTQAQNVQTFDDQIEGEGSDVAIPGAPAPEQEQPEPQVIEQEVAPQQDGEADEERPAYHQISIHGADDGADRGDIDDLLSEEHTELYRGIIPGERDEVDHLQASDDDRTNPITWVGFQPDDDRTRVFFQAPRAVEYQVQEAFDEDGELVVIFENAEISDQNFSLFIDTSHFDRTVTQIEATETDDGNVKVTLEMDEELEPEITTEGDYLYFDFPHDADDDEPTASR